MSLQWFDREPHYRNVMTPGAGSTRQVLLWGQSATPIAYCDTPEQAERVKQRLLAALADIEAEEVTFTSG